MLVKVTCGAFKSLLIYTLRPSAPYLFFYTCLTPDDFTGKWGSSATKCVN